MAEVLTGISLETAETQRGKYLLFYLGEEVFGIEIKYVMEIIEIQKINPLPGAPDYIKGVINLRGNIIPVIDMRLRLQKKPVSYTDRTCIIVINMSDISVGLIVDHVDEVSTIDSKNIVPPPGIRSGFLARYIKGIGKVGENIDLILDCDRLLGAQELQVINNIYDRENDK